MHRFLLLAVMILPVTPALAEVTVTNDRGGSAVIAARTARGPRTVGTVRRWTRR